MSTISRSPLQIVLADDHTLVRAGIRALVERIPNLEVVAEASDGREVLEILQSSHVDLVLMDIGMPGLNGIEAASRISRDFPEVRVLMLSMHRNEEYYWQALKAGAAGYILKKAATAELQAAIEAVSAGGNYVSQELAAASHAHGPNSIGGAAPLERLTARQREILQLIAEGQNTKSIASVLNVSPKTVEYHRAQLMERLRIFDVPGLVRFALQVGLITHDT